MTTARAVITGLLAIVVLEAAGAERQPSISQIAATVTQLGSGWTSSRVVALIDPLCSPSEMADENEDPQGFLRLAFRRGSYLIDVEGPIVYGVEYLKRLAEVLDSNFLEAQKTLGAGGEVPGAQK